MTTKKKSPHLSAEYYTKTGQPRKLLGNLLGLCSKLFLRCGDKFKINVLGFKRGQLMLITVLILGGTILGASAIAGLITTYRVRQSSDAKDSALAIFAADAGLERAFYQCFKQVVPDCADFDSTTDPLSNGAEYSVKFLTGPPSEIRSVGSRGRVSRALRFRY